AIGRRHALRYLALAERAEPELWGPASDAWLERLEREHANLRAALGWALADGSRAELGLRLAAALGRCWMLRSHFGEGRRWLERALAAGDGAASPARLEALSRAVSLADFHGDDEELEALAEATLALSRELGDRRAEIWALMTFYRVWA